MKQFIDSTGKKVNGLYRFTRLYDHINKNKTKIDSSHCLFKFAGKGNDDGVLVEHQEILLMIPYNQNYQDEIIRAIMCNVPAYDTVVWRCSPEVAFWRGAEDHTQTWKPCDPNRRVPHFIQVYLRLAFVNAGKQVFWKGRNFTNWRNKGY